MTHDPFQNYQTSGAYPGGVTPFGLPYSAFQSPFSPGAIPGQAVHNPGIGGYGFYIPYQQGAGIPAPQNPLQQLLALNPLAGLQNPYWQHPLAQNPWQNPLLATGQQNPLLNPAFAYQGWPQQQQPFAYPLAPQTMIGAGGFGQPFAQMNPLAQLALRQAAAYGINPLTGCF